jgi:hypothetical protein
MKEEKHKQNQRPLQPPPIPAEVPVNEIPAEKPLPKPSENKEFPNRCTWRDSSPANTTFEVSYLYVKHLENIPFITKDSSIIQYTSF